MIYNIGIILHSPERGVVFTPVLFSLESTRNHCFFQWGTGSNKRTQCQFLGYPLYNGIWGGNAIMLMIMLNQMKGNAKSTVVIKKKQDFLESSSTWGSTRRSPGSAPALRKREDRCPTSSLLQSVPFGTNSAAAGKWLPHCCSAGKVRETWTRLHFLDPQTPHLLTRTYTTKGTIQCCGLFFKCIGKETYCNHCIHLLRLPRTQWI